MVNIENAKAFQLSLPAPAIQTRALLRQTPEAEIEPRIVEVNSPTPEPTQRKSPRGTKKRDRPDLERFDQGSPPPSNSCRVSKRQRMLLHQQIGCA
jgi:hypothetical protein